MASSSSSQGHGKHRASAERGKSSSPHGKLSDDDGTRDDGDAQATSFLFVVNEFRLNYDASSSGQARIPTDKWHNVLPPHNRDQYDQELASEVMRFRNGRISRASSDSAHYYWTRPDSSGEGRIAVQTGNDSAYLNKYKSASVFSCNPLLPVVMAEDDFSIDVGQSKELRALHFLHSQGVSLVSYPFEDVACSLPDGIAPPAKYVAGLNASWIPSLVPPSYQNPYNAEQSRGLGGDLAVVLGLMAFQAGPVAAEEGDGGRNVRTVNEVFLGTRGESSGLWSDFQWRSTTPILFSAQESPRGFLTYICFDSENPSGSTAQNLARLEQRALVRD